MTKSIAIALLLLVAGCKESGPTTTTQPTTDQGTRDGMQLLRVHAGETVNLELTDHTGILVMVDETGGVHAESYSGKSGHEFTGIDGVAVVRNRCEHTGNAIARGGSIANTGCDNVIIQQDATPDSKCSNIVSDNAEVNCK
jgi:hypothetical protein